jgi:hypothetical protein
MTTIAEPQQLETQGDDTSPNLGAVFVISVESTVTIPKMGELQAIRMTMRTNTKFYSNFLV